MKPIGNKSDDFFARAASFMKKGAPAKPKPETAPTPEPAESVQLQSSHPTTETVSPAATANAQEVAAPVPVQPQVLPDLSKQDAQMTQQLAGNLITMQGKVTFQALSTQAQGDNNIMPVFQQMGQAANSLVQESEPDFYMFMAQNVQQLGDASLMASERSSAGNGQSYGQLLSDEMKVQAEGLALVAASPPEIATAVMQETEHLKSTADASKLRQSLDVLKSRMPPEKVKEAMDGLTSQPLYAASEAAKSIPDTSSTTLVNMSDTARSYIPLSMGAKSTFFQAQSGKGFPPAQQFANLGQRLTMEMFSKGGGLDRVSPNFAQFAGSLVRRDGDPMANGREAATNLTLLLMAMEGGTQRAPVTGENRDQAIKGAVKSMVLQQGLRLATSQYLQQSAMTQVQQGVPGPEPQNPALTGLLGGEPKTPEDHLNRHLASMLSPDQAASVKSHVDSHPLTKLAQTQDLSKIHDSFELPYGGEARLRGTLAGFAASLTAVAGTIQQADQPQFSNSPFGF